MDSVGHAMCHYSSILHFCERGKACVSLSFSCGLRQGDPLSPYLFLLVADVLSKLLLRSLHRRDISGLRMTGTCPILSHLFFADDAILFLQGKQRKCQALLAILRLYSEASGQVLIFDKSGIIFSANASMVVRGALCSTLEISEADPNAKYLGLPSLWGRSKTAVFGFLIERVLSKLQG